MNEALANKDDKQSIVLHVSANGEMKVLFTGVWHGRLIRGAVRSIERSYRAQKIKVYQDSLKTANKEVVTNVSK